ncbi:MAG: hypothetical protein V3S40_11155, partial [Kiloniellales bacterium]
GTAEIDAADYLRRARSGKPVAAYIAGQNAPPGRRMGHAGAIVSSDQESAAAKIEALRAAGALIVRSPSDIGATIAEALTGSLTDRMTASA